MIRGIVGRSLDGLPPGWNPPSGETQLMNTRSTHTWELYASLGTREAWWRDEKHR